MNAFNLKTLRFLKNKLVLGRRSVEQVQQLRIRLCLFIAKVNILILWN